MTDVKDEGLRATAMKSLGNPSAGKKRPVVRVKRKRKSNPKVAKKPPPPSSPLQERDELKRSKTADDIEDDQLEQEVLDLRSESGILRQKSKALAAEVEVKDQLIYQLRAQLAEKDAKLSTSESALNEKEEERAAWEVQARELVEEGNAALNELHVDYTQILEKYNELQLKHRELQESAGCLVEEIEDKDALLDKRDQKIMSLSNHRNDVEMTEHAAIKMLEGREQHLVAALASLEEHQRRSGVLKKNVARLTQKLKVVEAEKEELQRKFNVLNQGQEDAGRTSITSSSGDESAELSKLKSSNTMLQFNLSGVTDDLSKETKERKRLQSSVDGIIKQRDELKVSKEQAAKQAEKTISKMKTRLEKANEEIGRLMENDAKHEEKIKVLQERHQQRHQQALKRAQEDKDACLQHAQEDYSRVKLENIELESRLKEVCIEVDNFRRTLETEDSVALKAELESFKETYRKVVESNKKWKRAEDAWIAEKTRMEDELHEVSQRLVVLEDKNTSSPQEGGFPSEYISTMESMVGSFVIDFETMMQTMDEIKIEPGPMLKRAFSEFPRFKATVARLMQDRANNKPFDEDAYASLGSFLGIDLSEEDMPSPMENATNIYHLVMCVIKSYAKATQDRASTQEQMMLHLKSMMEKVSGVGN